jgi:hypothetical protein
MTTYSASDLVRLTGATYRQVDYWARTHLLVPSGRAANGCGSRREYSPVDLDLCRMLVSLNSVAPLQIARDVAPALRSVLEAPDRPERVFVSGEGAVSTSTPPLAELPVICIPVPGELTQAGAA